MVIAEAIARALASDEVSDAIEAWIERQQVEQIYGLTGGELDDKPLLYLDENEGSHSVAYHYDGVPEWAGDDFADRYECGVDYFTVIDVDNPYGWFQQEMRLSDGRRYFLVKTYTSGGEASCPLGACGNDEKVGEDSTEGMTACPLCEADEGEDHGVIYLGTGSEAVYKHVDFSCGMCGIAKSDLTDEAPICDCAYSEE
jgi:hypothetical protein